MMRLNVYSCLLVFVLDCNIAAEGPNNQLAPTTTQMMDTSSAVASTAPSSSLLTDKVRAQLLGIVLGIAANLLVLLLVVVVVIIFYTGRCRCTNLGNAEASPIYDDIFNGSVHQHTNGDYETSCIYDDITGVSGYRPTSDIYESPIYEDVRDISACPSLYEVKEHAPFYDDVANEMGCRPKIGVKNFAAPPSLYATTIFEEEPLTYESHPK
ncbi:uncharacterized protein LOC113155255 isoform X2 [Anabas testudineus]|uniref:uncharacterized protein LOC113155255 isoform X2 n=1 Tax=Anabas testudineus TaxID=64144 RepID=UPI000E453C96|nr:uncharacterized protein LOC113155255 isoform X2 [Anabas testudineus]